ncbi:hypothetical protein N7533_012001 [Penicillium manginii]|uniref:uncharacterized protein n=1 Tax=Penicillium manginii TaxID=203109 RepID=UPI002548FBDF|nr:uncharacterized protein N7533_012001 [Penicillium manginii]KAJ5739217.1 hypothetical protein N7533_012001 [Penicillium manginii]
MASVSDEPKPSTGVTTQDPQSPPSDNDGGERPVRKQLRETTIESTPSKENGRKRSFEESRDGPNDSPDDSRRKRSRETTPNNGQSTGAATSSNVSDHEHNPEHLLPATPKDLAKEDFITEVPQTEIPETQLDTSASYPRPADKEELGTDSAWEASDELSAGTDEGDFSSGLEEPKKSEARNSRDHYNKTKRTEPSASQLFEQTGSPSDPRMLAEVSNPEPSASIESQEPRPLDINPQPKESNMSAGSESYEDHPALKASSIEPDEFEDHPKSQSDDSSDSHVCNLPSQYIESVGSQEAETAVYNTRNSDSGKAMNHLQDIDHPEDPTLLQEKPSEYNARPKASFNPQNSRSIESESRNENRVNTDPSSQEFSNSATIESAKGLTKKRSREQLEKESPKKSETMSDLAQESDSAKNEREKKRHRDDSEERDQTTNKLFSASAFASAADSPFAKLAGAKSPFSTDSPATTEDKPASSSAFAGSALGGFAGSEKSPFGTLGSTTSSVFKSASPFSATPSAVGFGGIGGGFGSAAPAGKTSFASPNVSSTFGETKAAKPLGAEESDNEEDEGEGEGAEENNTFEAAKTDERFFEQTIETGEEEEKTIFVCKAKLFSFTDGEWKERGIGTFKVNARDVGGKKVGRMIMRADGALRVMLNSPVFEGMNYGDAKNKAPTNKQIFLASTEENRTVPLLLRTPNESYAQDLYRAIRKLLTGEDEDESDDEDA